MQGRRWYDNVDIEMLVNSSLKLARFGRESSGIEAGAVLRGFCASFIIQIYSFAGWSALG